MNNQLNWLRLTAVNGRTQVTFHRDKTDKKYKVNRKNRHRLNRALVPDRDECSFLVEGGMIADYYM